jgi:hypothetical protein
MKINIDKQYECGRYNGDGTYEAIPIQEWFESLEYLVHTACYSGHIEDIKKAEDTIKNAIQTEKEKMKKELLAWAEEEKKSGLIYMITSLVNKIQTL